MRWQQIYVDIMVEDHVLSSQPEMKTFFLDLLLSFVDRALFLLVVLTVIAKQIDFTSISFFIELLD